MLTDEPLQLNVNVFKDVCQWFQNFLSSRGIWMSRYCAVHRGNFIYIIIRSKDNTTSGKYVILYYVLRISTDSTCTNTNNNANNNCYLIVDREESPLLDFSGGTHLAQY